MRKALFHEGIFTAICYADEPLRPQGVRLLASFSPKLGRTVRAFDRAGFDQWIRLKADPGVNTFCEHPRRVGSGDEGALIDFWVAGRSNEEMLVLEHGHRVGMSPYVASARRAGRCPWHSVAFEECCRGRGSQLRRTGST